MYWFKFNAEVISDNFSSNVIKSSMLREYCALGCGVGGAGGNNEPTWE